MATGANVKLLRVSSANVSIVDTSFTVSLFFKRGESGSSGGIFEFLDKTSYLSTKAFQFRYENATTLEISANSVTIGHVSMIEQNGGWTYAAMVYNNTDTTLTIYGKSGIILAPAFKPQLKLSLASSNNGLRVGYSTRFGQSLSKGDAVACVMVYGTALNSDDIVLAEDACRKSSQVSTTIKTTTPIFMSPSNLPTSTQNFSLQAIHVQLRNASKTGNVDEVRELLELGFLDVNWCKADDLDCVSGFSCVKNGTALIHAIHRNPSNVSEIVRLLVEHGANVNVKEASNGQTPLMFATLRGNLEIIGLLLDRGADIDAKDNWDETALMKGVQFGFEEAARLLVERGSNVEANDGNGETALMMGASKGYLEIVRMLLDRGAQINAKDNDDETALIKSAHNGKVETVKLLLDRGADVEAKNDGGETALMKTARSNYANVEIARLLLDRGANINAKNDCGETSLMLAAMYGKVDIVRLLLNRGASRDGCTTSWSPNCTP